jgi:hypothetical protein
VPQLSAQQPSHGLEQPPREIVEILTTWWFLPHRSRPGRRRGCF